ncbi:hypothetical protein GO491_08095 [Flavobacteriaceae bacterium Ap0902]|nr:hypothetical protein [Flavobacteriaceae bacterium Ap0902]
MNEGAVNKRIWWIAGIYVLINALQSFLTPLINDEAYYWVWSQNLDWGYFDHPPMVAFWANLGFKLFQNELGARLVAILFGGLGFVLLGKLLEIKTYKQLQLYCFLFFSMVLFQVFGFINTPDAPLLFFGILYFYLLKKFLNDQSNLHAMLLGIAMALLIYSKYHGILIIIFSLLPHTFRLIKSKYFYIAVFTGILCYAPHIWWQFDNEFISLEYHLVKRNVRNVFKWNYPGDYLLSLVWASSPLLFFHHIKALVKSRYTTQFQKSLLWTIVGIIGFFILITFKRYIQAQWSLVAFIPLLIVSYQYYKNKPKAFKTIKVLSMMTLVIICMARIYFMIQDVPYPTQYHGWKDFMIKAGDKTKGIAVFEKYQYASLFNFYNYPKKKARTYVTLENRTSQYNLWHSEDDLEGKEITYFSRYMEAKDSVVILDRDKLVPYYLEHIPVYHSAANIKMEVSNVEKVNDSLRMQVKFINTGDFTVDLSKENHFKLVHVSPKEPFSNEIFCFDEIPYKSMVLEPGLSNVLTITIPQCEDSPEDFMGYFGIVNHNLSPKKQSNYIDIE